MKAALVISERDNVATALEALEAGRSLELGGHARASCSERIPSGHKVALVDIAAGRAGRSSTAARSALATRRHRGGRSRAHAQRRERARPRRPRARGPAPSRACASPSRTARPPSVPTDVASPGGVRVSDRPGFLGFRRPDGRVGVRNHVLVVPTVICSSVVCERIADALPASVVALPHLAGCGQLGPDMRATHETLAAYCGHPERRRRAGGRARVRAGHRRDAGRGGARRPASPPSRSRFRPRAARCGRSRAAARSRARLADGPRRVDARVVRRRDRSSCRSSAAGRTTPRDWPPIPTLGRSPIGWSISAASAVLGEIAEIMGAEHLLAARASRPDVGRRLLRVIDRVETEAMALGLDIRGTQPSPGNIRGGLTTIEEKSLGATHKGGERSPVVDVVPYAGRITQPGLTVMDTPGLDVESVTGMVGGGAQVVVFTTGLGTPTGNPIAPVIKMTGNARTAQHDGRQPRPRRERRHRRHRDARRRRRSAVRRSARRRVREADGRRSAAATASSPSTGGIRRSKTRGSNFEVRTWAAGPKESMATERAAVHDTPQPAPNARGLRPLDHLRRCCFFAATINYIDRQVIGLLKPTLQKRVRLVGARLRRHRVLVSARVRDRVPDRRPADRSARHAHRASRSRSSSGASRRSGHAEAPALGPVRAPACSACSGSATRTSVAGFMLMRFLLGLGEAGNFPARDQDRRRVVPETRARARHRHLQLGHERRRARHAARRALDHRHLRLVLGVRRDRRDRLPVAGRSGWRSISRPMRIRASAPANWPTSGAIRRIRRCSVAWRELVRHRQTWAFAVGKFMTDPIWWLYLFWIPDFLEPELRA